MRRIMCPAVCVALIATFCCPAFGQAPQKIDEMQLSYMIQNSSLVIEGTIADLHVKNITRGEEYRILKNYPLYGDFDRSFQDTTQTIVTEVTITISQIIAGDSKRSSIQIVLPEGRIGNRWSGLADHEFLDLNVGDSAIVALTHDADQVFVTSYRSLFRREGDTLVPYAKEFVLDVDDPVTVIEKAAKKRSLEYLSRHADLVCLGTVLSWIDPKDHHDVRVVYSLDERLRGYAKSDTLIVDLSPILGALDHVRPGMRSLLFLAGDGPQYSVLGGANGYLLIRDGMLYRRHKLPTGHTVQKLKAKIEALRAVEQ